jgi:hypothetical protein
MLVGFGSVALSFRKHGHHICYHFWYEVYERGLKATMEPNPTAYWHLCTHSQAVQNGRAEVVQQLLAAGADVRRAGGSARRGLSVIPHCAFLPHRKSAYNVFGFFGAALQKNIGIFHTKSLKMAPKTPNESYK